MSKRGRGNSKRQVSSGGRTGTRLGSRTSSTSRASASTSLQVPVDPATEAVDRPETRRLKRQRTNENLAESADADVSAEIIPGVLETSLALDSAEDDEDEEAETRITPSNADQHFAGAIEAALDSMEALEMPTDRITVTYMIIVPKALHGGAAPVTKSLLVSSDMPYEEFCSEVGKALDPSELVSFSDLELSYKPDWATRNAFNSLDTASAYTQMLHVIINEYQWRKSAGIPTAPTPEAMSAAMARIPSGGGTEEGPGKGKGKGRAVPKPFAITITDARNAAAIKASVKAAHDRSNSKVDEFVEGSADLNPSDTRFLLAARKKWSCSKDLTAVCIGYKSNGTDHVHLTPRDIGEWRLLVDTQAPNPATNKSHTVDDIPLVYIQRYQVIVKGQSSTDQAPSTSGMPVVRRRPSVLIDAEAPSHTSTTWSLPSSSFPPSATHSDPGYGTNPPSTAFSHRPRPSASHPFDINKLLQQHNIIPSIDVPFPLISEWLRVRVDGTLRGAGHPFLAYAPALEENGYLRVDGLANPALSAEILSNMLQIPRGFADSLLFWAQEDVTFYKSEVLRERKII